MSALLRRGFLLSSLSLLAVLPSFGANWTQPTPDELKMTADPAAPDAPAVYLFRDEMVDDKLHFHRVYARVKILSEKGKDQFGDVEIPYEAGMTDVKDVEGRTIQADGTVVPFTGKPYQKELLKTGKVKINAKVFTMPDVQVGSILEYRYTLDYADNSLQPPDWQIQQDVYVHKAHYHFNRSTSNYIVNTDAMGHENVADRLLYYQQLPGTTKVREGLDGFDLTVENIPALPQEDFQPPAESYAYRVVFYYSPNYSGKDFWTEEGKYWSKDVDRFANPSDAIRQAVAQIVVNGDTDDQKLRKIYSAVMGLENTRFTREHSAAENKAQGLRVKTAADIWQQKRGSDDEITRLFISMARAAGFKAYAMIVTERDRNLLNTGYLYWGQLEDEIAIVTVDGKEQYFDPGQRDCEYGRLHWMHTLMGGVRQSDKGPVLALTPAAEYKDNQTVRIADLELGPDGTVKGQLRLLLSGAEALTWRQVALRNDEDEAKRQMEGKVQAMVPAGVHVTMNHFLGLKDPGAKLMAILDVSGSMGTKTGKRVFLPSAFFEARQQRVFVQQARESNVDLHYPWLEQDTVTVTLAPGLTVESLPKPAEIPIPKLAVYKSAYGTKGNVWQSVRTVAMGTGVFKREEYAEVRDFFQKSAAQDQEQVVLTRTVVTAAAGTASK